MKVLLRKLAHKSRLDFGKYSGQTIETILKVDPTYIGYVYYNRERLSFIPLILDEIGIVDEFLIDKPNISKEVFTKWKKSFGSNSEFTQTKKRISQKYPDVDEKTLNIMVRCNLKKTNNMNSNSDVYARLKGIHKENSSKDILRAKNHNKY